MAKTPLEKAFKKIDKLNLSITLDQKLDLNKVLADLANASYNKGSNKGSKIAQEIYTR